MSDSTQKNPPKMSFLSLAGSKDHSYPLYHFSPTIFSGAVNKGHMRTQHYLQSTWEVISGGSRDGEWLLKDGVTVSSDVVPAAIARLHQHWKVSGFGGMVSMENIRS